MLSKLDRLLKIPAPHRMGMVWRTLGGRYPKLTTWRSRRYAARLVARLSPAPDAPQGPRYLAATAHRSAGIGHVLSEWNTGLLVARQLGLDFLHSSVNSPWEEFLGFSRGFPDIREFWKKSGVEIIRLPLVDWKNADVAEVLRPAIANIRSPKPLLFMLFDGQNSYRQHTTGPELRKFYWSHPSRTGASILRESDAINVSVHIRRRNAMDMKNPTVHDTSGAGYKSRYLDLEYFEQLMDAVNRAVPNQKVVFNIFSQGNPADLHSLLRFGDVRFRLSESEYNTFHNLAASDVLITSPSSFSFKAGMLCGGLKLCRHPWWHEVPSDDEWCPTSAEPAGEADRIIAFLRSRLPSAQLASQTLVSLSS